MAPPEPSGGSIRPPGWPRDLAPPQTAEFGDRVTLWLLDRAPGGWRSHRILRAHPRALAHLVSHHCDAVLAGLRDSYSSARRELNDLLTLDQLDAVLVALEAEGATAAETAREVSQVREALDGAVWRPRL